MEASADADRSIQRTGSYPVVLEGSCNCICWCRHDGVRSSPTGFQVRKLMFYSYLVFPSAFNNNPDLTVRPVNATVVASILLTIGYSTSVALWFTCHSSLFRLDTILA